METEFLFQVDQIQGENTQGNQALRRGSFLPEVQKQPQVRQWVRGQAPGTHQVQGTS